MWVSPDGNKIAFATFNDTNVDTMNFPLYGRPGDTDFQYPIQQSIKYPKVGWLVDLSIKNLLKHKKNIINLIILIMINKDTVKFLVYLLIM